MKTQTVQTLRARLSNPRNKLARFYDNGGTEAGGSFDRYTASYLGLQSRTDGVAWFWYRGMSTNPSQPQGFGCSGESKRAPVDFPPARLGRRNHLGKRIRFEDLPPDCKMLVIQDLKD